MNKEIRTKLENVVLNLRKYLNKLEDKGYYHPELVTKKDIRTYRRLNKLWSYLYHKLDNLKMENI